MPKLKSSKKVILKKDFQTQHKFQQEDNSELKNRNLQT
jgi:hypothetical protein